MKMSRLFEIMYLLLSKRLITAKELSEYFGVSSRTIYRDVDVLINAGIPIYKTKGKGGGIGLPEAFPGEDNEDGVAGWCRFLEFIGSLYENGSPDPASLFSHFTKLLCKREGNWVNIDFTVPKPQCKETFATLKKAILQKQYVSFSITTPCGEEYVDHVRPLQLCYRGIDWYLSCYGKPDGNYHFYKLNRICSLQILEETFEPPEQPLPISPPTSKDVPAFRIEIKIAQRAAERVYDEFEEDQIQKNKDGSFTVTATYLDAYTMNSHILSYGPDAAVLSPASVRQQIREKVAQMGKHYE